MAEEWADIISRSRSGDRPVIKASQGSAEAKVSVSEGTAEIKVSRQNLSSWTFRGRSGLDQACAGIPGL